MNRILASALLLIITYAAKSAQAYVHVQGFFELQDYYENYYTDEQMQIDGKWIYMIANNVPDDFDNSYYDRRLKQKVVGKGRRLQTGEGEIYGCKDFGLEDIDDAHEFVSWLNFVFHSAYSVELINDVNLPFGSQYDYKNEQEYYNQVNKDVLGPFNGKDKMWIVDCISSEKIFFGAEEGAETSSKAPKSTKAPSSKAPKSTKAPSSKAPKSTKAPSSKAPKSTKAPSSKAPKSTKAPTWTKSPKSTKAPKGSGIAGATSSSATSSQLSLSSAIVAGLVWLVM